MNYIAYLAHGDVGYLNECRFSLLKYLHVYNLNPPADTAIVIYTDKPEFFENFIPFFKHFFLETVNAEKIQSWLEGTGYVHRAKTKMIQDILSKRSGNLLFFDTDTYITEPIETFWSDMTKGVVYFHTTEGVIDREHNYEFRKWDRFLSSAQIAFGNKTFTYNKNFQVWNTGVLGLSSTYAPVIDDSLLLIDSIHKQFPKHISEQVACSYCFQTVAPVKPAEAKVFHYWNLKEFRVFLDHFFTRNQEESIPNLVKLASPVDVVRMQQEKRQFRNLPVLQRWLKQVRGKGWRIENYEKRH